MRLAGTIRRSLELIRALPNPGLTLLALIIPFFTGTPLCFAQSGDEGRALFQEKCVACHTIGAGRLVGPDLQGITGKTDSLWLRRFILHPQEMIAEGDARATQLLAEYNNLPMPDMGLSESQVDLVIGYLKGSSPKEEEAASPGGTSDPAARAAPGNSVSGKNLFIGTTLLEEGGPPCISCHTVRTLPSFGGGDIGPDLTGTAAKFGSSGLAQVLATFPFPTMIPVYRNRLLTPQEQADLAAFFESISGEGREAGETTPHSSLVLISGGVSLLLVLVAQLVWRKRLGNVRADLVAYAGRQGKRK